MDQIKDYQTFQDVGKHTDPPKGYQRIRVHLVFDVKYDLCQKACQKAWLVAGGLVTAPLEEDTYSGVVSLRSIRMCLLVAELNKLEIVAADIGNAYLEALTKEKIYVVAGPEFGPELEGHTLIMHKALYGLHSSSARF